MRSITPGIRPVISCSLRGVMSLGVLGSVCLIFSNPVLAAPTPFNLDPGAGIVSWDDEGWHQVQQNTSPWAWFCQSNNASSVNVANGAVSISGKSCQLPAGSYKIQNFGSSNTAAPFEVVEPTSAPALTPFDLDPATGIVSWDDEGWHQVQETTSPWDWFCQSNNASSVNVANGAVSISGKSCQLPVGSYKIKNFGSTSDPAPFEVTTAPPPPIVPALTPFDLDPETRIVSWDAEGWHQVQQTTSPWDWFCQSNNASSVNVANGAVSISGNSCQLPVGSYKIQNFDSTSEAAPFDITSTTTTVTTVTPPSTSTTSSNAGNPSVVARNNFHDSQVLTASSTPLDDLRFAHRNAAGVLYPADYTERTMNNGVYDSDAHEPGLTELWGGNSNASGTFDGDNYNFATGSNPKPENGTPGTKGDFRIECQWSHFAYDDPIVNHTSAKRRENNSHLHMYWGNTKVKWDTLLDRANKSNPDYFTNNAGSTCQGFGLNRSSYWMPALMHNNDLAMVPEEIIVYYKTKHFDNTNDDGSVITPGLEHHELINTVNMPQGLQLISGNGDREGATVDDSVNERNLNKRVWNWGGVAEDKHSGDDWTTSPYVVWMCGINGLDYRKFNRIPTQQEWTDFCDFVDDNRDGVHDVDGDGNEIELQLNATVYFPQCRKDFTEGVTVADGTLRDNTFRDHVRHTTPDSGCPTSHPKRMPQLGYRVYWDISGFAADGYSLNNLRLSSDPLPEYFEPRTDTRAAILARQPADPDGQVRNPGAPYRASLPLAAEENYAENYEVANCRGEDRVRGGTLHADWVAGWNDSVQSLWLDNCSKDSVNCTLGQTGTSVRLASLTVPGGRSMDYAGHPAELRNDADELIGQPGSYMIAVPGSGMDMCSTSETPTPIAPPPPIETETASELLSDGGFEFNDDQFGATDWIIVNTKRGVTATIDWQGRNSESERSIVIENRSALGHGLIQNVIVPATSDQVEIDQMATLTAYVKMYYGGDSSSARLMVQVQDDNAKWQNHNLGWFDVNGWSWTKLEADWPVNWLGTLRRIRFRVDGPKIGTTYPSFRVDDASFIVR